MLPVGVRVVADFGRGVGEGSAAPLLVQRVTEKRNGQPGPGSGGASVSAPRPTGLKAVELQTEVTEVKVEEVAIDATNSADHVDCRRVVIEQLLEPLRIVGERLQDRLHLGQRLL